MTEGSEVQGRERQLLERVIRHELETEERVRRAALLAWSLTFGVLPLAGTTFFLVRTLGGVSLEALRAALIVLVVAGILSLFVAALTTVAWLFRSRAPTLAAIERRLAALEAILLSRGGGA